MPLSFVPLSIYQPYSIYVLGGANPKGVLCLHLIKDCLLYVVIGFNDIANPFMLAKIMICCYLNAKIYFFNPWETIVGSRQLAIQHHQVKFQNPVSWLSSIHFCRITFPFVSFSNSNSACLMAKFGVFDDQTRRVCSVNTPGLPRREARNAFRWLPSGVMAGTRPLPCRSAAARVSCSTRCCRSAGRHRAAGCPRRRCGGLSRPARARTRSP